VVELDNSANTREVLTDIKDAVDKLSLPEDAEDPSVVELSSQNELMFELLLYGKEAEFSEYDLINKAHLIKNELE